MVTGPDSAKRLECGGLPALLDPPRPQSGGKLPHSKRFAAATAGSIFTVCGAARGLRSDPNVGLATDEKRMKHGKAIPGGFSLTPRFSGVIRAPAREGAVSTASDLGMATEWETAEAVKVRCGRVSTPLKWGVNEKAGFAPASGRPSRFAGSGATLA